MKRKNVKTFLILLAACTGFVIASANWKAEQLAAGSASQSTQSSFERDIRPILAARCLSCHGEKKQSGGLRLDAKALAMRGGLSGPAITPGKAEESLLYRRIASQNDDERMPPVGERLSHAELALLKAWIDAGAEWPDGDG
jgi:mono/diheme cytochrome c family protein